MSSPGPGLLSLLVSFSWGVQTELVARNTVRFLVNAGGLELHCAIMLCHLLALRRSQVLLDDTGCHRRPFLFLLDEPIGTVHGAQVSY